MKRIANLEVHKRLLKLLKILTIIFISLYFLVCLLVFIFQKSLIFFPSKNIAYIPNNIEEVFFKTSDNVQLNAWYLDNNSKTTVLFFHGNAGNISHRMSQIKIFDELNLNALMIDYRGYGKSSGEISRENDLYLDAESALNYLIKNKQIKIENIIIWGRSLGGAIAIDLAQNKKIKALIIESTFNSMNDMGVLLYKFLPIKILSKFHFRSDLKIKNIKSKLLIIHSKNDEVIPYNQGQKLFNNAKNIKQFLTISGTHNSGFMKSVKIYLETIKNFID